MEELNGKPIMPRSHNEMLLNTWNVRRHLLQWKIFLLYLLLSFFLLTLLQRLSQLVLLLQVLQGMVGPNMDLRCDTELGEGYSSYEISLKIGVSF